MRPLELWGGVECTCNRVGDRYFDQLNWSGHDRRPEDIDLFAALGLAAIRYPVLWERHAPRHPDAMDFRWSDERLARLRDHGVRPIVGLVHHGSGPAYTSLVDERFPTLLARYARAVAERYPWVTDWTPVNEPLTTARFSALYGHWYPHARDDRSFVRALLNQVRGVTLAMREIRAVNPSARLIQTEDFGRPCGTPAVRRQVEFERHRRWLTWDLLAGRVDPRHPLYGRLRAEGGSEAELAALVDEPCEPDVYGVNYYVTSDRWLDDRLDEYPASCHGGNCEMRYADVEAVRARRRGITGHEEHLLAIWKRYGRPLAITEVHLGCTREEQMRWLAAAWRGAERARARGAEVCAVTAWALLGSYDWSSLVTVQNGHYEPGLFDVRGPAPRKTALATLARRLARGESPGHAVLRCDGWWRRPERLILGPASRARLAGMQAPAHPRPSILIVGRRGTLGRAFKLICEARGLRPHVVGRPEMDICDPARIDAVMRQVRPWAVINAAGYVRVDAAESDSDGCWRDNVEGPVNLAAACRRRGVPLVTFSSDLVFDGSLGRPYVEDDAPAPLNVYGASKAEAERRVLDLHPDALMIRTSAFFGPWDDANFATVALRTVAAGHAFRAAADYTVSPTYVPDLVNAALDLLIDRERGIWHLANTGETTWYDFGRMVVRAAGLPEELVEPCGWRDVWQPAPRPAYSVLGSARGRVLPPLDSAVKVYAGAAAAALDEIARCASS